MRMRGTGLIAALCAAARTVAVSLPPSIGVRDAAHDRQIAKPVIDLGDAGLYRGIIQNNGTVASWKGIPYAKPPVGSLRFMPPEPLGEQSTNIVDTSEDALRCVQFSGASYGVINSNIVGVKAGPGQEDCLKLWIWKPVDATAESKLPVMFYVHGGGLQYSAAPNNDFSDWVGQSQNFIAVNVGYRLGALGFMGHTSLPSANAGILDQRLALKWLSQHVAAFGGDPDNVTIMGQSGGGYGIVSQMALYDGDSEGLFQQAIPRSIQRAPMFKIEELEDRNVEFARLLNCTSGQDQLDCFRNATVQSLVDAYASITRFRASSGMFSNLTFGSSAAFLPMIDNITLTDTITRLFQNGRIANVSLIAGAVNDEGANAVPRNITSLNPATNQIWNLSASQVEEVAGRYPVNETFGFASPDSLFLSEFKAYIQSLHPFGEAGITGSERVVGRYMAQAFGANRVWNFRFNAPTVGTNYSNPNLPLNYVTHSADNSYLQNSTAVMKPFEKAIAHEWRAYLGSFIRTGNPNNQKLASSPVWHNYGFLGDPEASPMRLVPQFNFLSNLASGELTGTQMEVAQRAQIQREDWWTMDGILEATRL